MYRQHTHLSSSFSLSPLPALTCHFRHFSACACMRGGGEGTKGKKGCRPRTGRVRATFAPVLLEPPKPNACSPIRRRRDRAQHGATRAKDSRRACSGGRLLRPTLSHHTRLHDTLRRHSAAQHCRTTLGCTTLCDDTRPHDTVPPHPAAPHSATTLGCPVLAPRRPRSHTGYRNCLSRALACPYVNGATVFNTVRQVAHRIVNIRCGRLLWQRNKTGLINGSFPVSYDCDRDGNSRSESYCWLPVKKRDWMNGSDATYVVKGSYD